MLVRLQHMFLEQQHPFLAAQFPTSLHEFIIFHARQILSDAPSIIYMNFICLMIFLARLSIISGISIARWHEGCSVVGILQLDFDLSQPDKNLPSKQTTDAPKPLVPQRST